MRAHILLALVILTAGNLFAQDSLVLKNNRRIPFARLSMLEGEIEIKNALTKEMEIYPCDSVYGYSEGMKERTYFLKKDPESEDDHYLFMNRLQVGSISLFESVGSDRGLYASKGNRLEKVFGVTDSKAMREEQLATFKTMVEDDSESLSYLASGSFRHRWKDIELVVEYYNRRNFVAQEILDNDVIGKLYLYRTKFQKTDEVIKIRLNGKDHDLYIEDYIILNLPVDFASKLQLRDSEVKNELVISGELLEQYFEVLYDSKTNTFRFDKKEGTELQFEFYKIRDKVQDRITHD